MIVKNLNFGDTAREQVFKGITKLTQAVSSTLGASGKCVLLEDAAGKPIITKDGVTVADSVILLDPVENMGATLLKEAARKTVQQAGDGTTTATVLAHAILQEAYKVADKTNSRVLKEGINSAVEKVVKYLESISVSVEGDMIDHIATISTNNDPDLGKLIADAFRAVDLTGVVMMEPSAIGKTEIKLVEGAQYEKGLTNRHFITNAETQSAELENPLVLLVESKIDSIRQIQTVLEYVIKNNKPLLVSGDVEKGVLSALAMNKIKGNIKINVVDAPTYGVNRKQLLDDLSLLTGATIINEDFQTYEREAAELKADYAPYEEKINSAMETIKKIEAQGISANSPTDVIDEYNAAIQTVKDQQALIISDGLQARENELIDTYKQLQNRNDVLMAQADKTKNLSIAVDGALKNYSNLDRMGIQLEKGFLGTGSMLVGSVAKGVGDAMAWTLDKFELADDETIQDLYNQGQKIKGAAVAYNQELNESLANNYLRDIEFRDASWSTLDTYMGQLFANTSPSILTTMLTLPAGAFGGCAS